MNYTRADYMNKVVTHQEYYGQFATTSVKMLVTSTIGVGAIMRSTNPHFNDIPLACWDRLHMSICNLVGYLIKEANGNCGISLSDTVCIAKAAARQIREENEV